MSKKLRTALRLLKAYEANTQCFTNNDAEIRLNIHLAELNAIQSKLNAECLGNTELVEELENRIKKLGLANECIMDKQKTKDKRIAELEECLVVIENKIKMSTISTRREVVQIIKQALKEKTDED
jgi:hypothetical protein